MLYLKIVPIVLPLNYPNNNDNNNNHVTTLVTSFAVLRPRGCIPDPNNTSFQK